MEGELCVKGDIVFKEYFNDPEATAKAKQNGWFKTGDLCQIDPDGYIHIIGRSKNLIILSDGNNVSPEEIEGYFSGHSCIKSIFVSESQEKKNCLVASVHPEWDPDQEATYEEVKEKIKHHFRETNKTLPAYKRVNEIVFYDQDFEKTALGKIRRFKYEKETKEHAG